MLDIKEKLLVFLYEQRLNHSFVNVNSVFGEFGLDIVDVSKRMLTIRNIIQELQSEGLIQVNNEYRSIGNSEGGIMNDLTNTFIKAKLTSVKGQDYVKAQYRNRQQSPNIIHVHNNKGQIIQTNQSHLIGDSQISPTQIKNKQDERNNIGNIIAIITLILTAFGVWFAYLQLK